MRLIFLICICLLLSHHSIQAQTIPLQPERIYNVTDSLIKEGDIEQVEKLLEQIQSGTVDDKILASILCCKAHLLVNTGSPKEGLHIADSLCQASDDEGLTKGIMINTAGLAYMTLGRYNKALGQFEKGLEIFKTIEREDKQSESYNNIGLVYWNTGKNQLAEEYFQKALAIRKMLYDDHHPEIAALYNNLGLIYSRSDKEKALDFFHRSIEINKSVYGEKHTTMASAYNNIAIIYKQKGSSDKALHHFEKVRNIWEEMKGASHPNVAFVLSNIGQVYEQSGDIDQALHYYNKALSIYQQQYGEKHPDIANVYNLIAVCHEANKHYAEAFKSIQKALHANIPQDIKGKTNAPIAVNEYFNGQVLLSSLMLQAQLYEAFYTNKSFKVRDLEKARMSLMSCDSLIEKLRHTQHNEDDKLALGNLAAEVYEDGMRIALMLKELTWKEKYDHEAFYFAERNKATVLLNAITEAQARSFANVAEDIVEEESTLRSSIAWYEQQMAKAKDQEEMYKLRNEMFNKKRAYDELIRKMETEYPEYYKLKHNSAQVSVRDVQQSIPEGTMVAMYAFSEKDDLLYCFYVTTDDFWINTVEEDINRYISGLRNGILYKLKSPFVYSSHHLYKALFSGKRNGIFSREIPASITNLVVIPDGRLGTIPFETLFTSKTSSDQPTHEWPYLLKKATVKYAYSATLLLNHEDKNSSYGGESIFLCAPVTFNDTKSSTTRKAMSDLPGTEAEVRAIREQFKAQNKQAVTSLRDSAQESLVKSRSMHDYTYIHFATHGIVDESHPELSRIFLAVDSSGKEDGMLHTGEIYNLNFNAELVTLSACETGLGKYTKGEGIIGLTRALLYAGAENILVSLWPVADQSTSDLMILFYENLLSGMSKSEALRAAKLQLIKDGIPEAEESFDAFYWSPFILIGGIN